MNKLELLLAEALSKSVVFKAGFDAAFPEYAAEPIHECARCARNVRNKNALWLERKVWGGYFPSGNVSARSSQGHFAFHLTCAIKELKGSASRG